MSGAFPEFVDVKSAHPERTYTQRKRLRQLITQMNNVPNGQFSLFPTDVQGFTPVMQQRDFMPYQGVHLPDQSRGVLLSQPTAGTLPAITQEDDETARITHAKGKKLAPLEVFRGI